MRSPLTLINAKNYLSKRGEFSGICILEFFGFCDSSGHDFSRAEDMRQEAALAAEGMAVPRRHGSPPGTYFVSSKTWEGHSIFQDSDSCEIFLDALLHYRGEGKYLLHGFVLMPNHFHALLTPSRDVTLERAVQFIKGGSARRIGEAKQRRFPVWQRGFSDHRIRDAADLALHIAYIDQNPVRKALAVEARQYLWSSASGVYRMDEVPQGLKPLR